MIDQNTFTSWLDLYGTAWETLDPEAIIKIFSEEALYYETPYSQPFKGRKGIHQYWSNNAQATQKDVSFGYDSITMNESAGQAHWWAAFTLIDTGEIVEIDGYLLAEFNSEQQCSCFREWWHVKNEKQL